MRQVLLVRPGFKYPVHPQTGLASGIVEIALRPTGTCAHTTRRDWSTLTFSVLQMPNL